MKASALAISLILILVPLAGCSGTDTEVKVDLSNEDINDLIDENLEDVMNNTTVVVFQEYHNNTTVINHNSYSSNTTTNVDESGASTSTTTYNYNGSSEQDIRMFTVQWSMIEELGDPLNESLTRPICRYYSNGICNSEFNYGNGDDYDGDGVPDEGINIDDYDVTTLTTIEYNGQIVEITATCYDAYAYYRMDDEDWREYLANNYGYNSNDIENAASTLDNRMNDFWESDDVEFACDRGYTDWIILFEIDLELGTMLEFLSIPEETVVDINCDDGFGTGIGNGSDSHLVGGHENCTVSGSTVVQWESFETQEYLYDENNGTNYWKYRIELGWYDYYSPPESFAVYFELHPVTVHQ